VLAVSEPVSELTGPTDNPPGPRPRPTDGRRAIVHQLEGLGVRRAYGVPRESDLEVLDALLDQPVSAFWRHTTSSTLASCNASSTSR